jgi:hypothetical protein
MSALTSSGVFATLQMKIVLFRNLSNEIAGKVYVSWKFDDNTCANDKPPRGKKGRRILLVISPLWGRVKSLPAQIEAQNHETYN